MHERGIRLVRHGPLPVVLSLVLAAGCGGGSGGAGGTPEGSAQPATNTPAVEGTGSEEPAPGGGGGPAIDTAGLPIGGGSDGTGAQQCFTVVWAGAVTPSKAIAVEVTSVLTSAPDTFHVTACDPPQCQGYVFTDQGDCHVGIRITARGGAQADLLLSGRVRCATGQEECRAFTATLKPVTLTITYEPPTTDEPSTSDSPQGTVPSSAAPEPSAS